MARRRNGGFTRHHSRLGRLHHIRYCHKPTALDFFGKKPGATSIGFGFATFLSVSVCFWLSLTQNISLHDGNVLERFFNESTVVLILLVDALNYEFQRVHHAPKAIGRYKVFALKNFDKFSK